MGKYLARVRCTPDYVLCSTAVRAVKTYKRVAKAGGWDAPVELSESLYVPTTSAVFQAVQSAPDTCTTLLVVGHEPTWSEMVRLLAGGSVSMPTSAAACIEVNVDNWGQVEPGSGTLMWINTPKTVAK